jgi:formiminotetrahydrofolate cyclodeaminase
MSSFKDLSIEKFLETLASSSPTPGGGTVAAVGGATAASLIAMVCLLTIGKKNYEKSEKEMKKIYSEVTKYKKELLQLADKDSEAFEHVMSAYKISKENLKRKEKIKQALKLAMEIPLRVSKICEELTILAKKAAKTGNKNAYSDAKSAEYFAKAAKLSAQENVEINLSAIKSLK